jgi:hypothetical protein
VHKEIIAEFSYEIPELTDEEIQNYSEEQGITNVDPEAVRKYIRESLYKMFCEAARRNSDKEI